MTDDPFCTKCGSYHPAPECNHDQARACRYCTRPVGWLSTGGPDVCAACEVHGVPPSIYMGRQKPYDFHAERIAVEKARQEHSNG